MADSVMVRAVAAIRKMIAGGDAVVEVTTTDPAAAPRLRLNRADASDCLTIQARQGTRNGDTHDTD